MGSIQNRVEDKWFYGSGDMWILVGLVLVDATTPHRVLNAFLNGLQIVLLWFSLRILQIRLKMNLNNCWCLLQPSSYIWIGKNYVIFFSIQIIVSLWCILLFCLLHDCEILHRNEVFSDRIEIEKTEVLNLTLGCWGKIIILAPVVCGSQFQDRVT